MATAALLLKCLAAADSRKRRDPTRLSAYQCRNCRESSPAFHCSVHPNHELDLQTLTHSTNRAALIDSPHQLTVALARVRLAVDGWDPLRLESHEPPLRFQRRRESTKQGSNPGIELQAARCRSSATEHMRTTADRRTAPQRMEEFLTIGLASDGLCRSIVKGKSCA